MADGSGSPSAGDPLAGTQLGEAVLARALSAYQAALGSRLIAGYALGSLAHGGFSPLVSDVDLGLVLDNPLRARDRLTIRAVAQSVKAKGTELDQRLSVFWRTPTTLRGEHSGGRFPPLDRLDLLEYGRLLAGRDVRAAVARPDRTELLVAGAEFALDYLGARSTGLPRLRPKGDSALAEIRTPERLAARGPRRVTKIVLFPVRFLYTAETGRVGTNAAAAEHYLAGPDAPAPALVTAAMAWRRRWPGGHEVTELLNRELTPLYVHYLEDHIARLEAVSNSRLASSFRRWQSRLAA